MKKKKQIMAAALLSVVCMSVTGCSLYQGNKDRQPVNASQAETDTKEEIKQQPSGKSEEETKKPTDAHPEDIEPFPHGEKETQAQPMKNGKRIVLMTDIHYLADSLTDKGEEFQYMVEHGDGKLTNYVWEITDAAFEQAEMLKPDVIILSGDLTLNGEKESHKELAKKLEQVEKAGVQVVVIPGNHDINNKSAASFDGRSRQPAQIITADEFAKIYNDFGYGEALDRDSASLSYTYDLGPDMRLLMLDSCQYSPVNKIGGMIKTETYDWIDDQLEKAWEDGVILLPVAHHNLLDESKIYVEDCTIEHSEELVDRLEEEDRGIYEIVTSSLSTPPCQYGVLEYRDDETFSYHTQKVDMEKWARRHKSTDENLLNFNTYAPAALKTIFYNQSYDAMKDSAEEETGDIFVKLTKSQKEQMSEVYAQLNAACYGGKAYEIVKEATGTVAYKMWQEYCYPMILFEYLEYIVEDAVKDYNYLEAND